MRSDTSERRISCVRFTSGLSGRKSIGTLYTCLLPHFRRCSPVEPEFTPTCPLTPATSPSMESPRGASSDNHGGTVAGAAVVSASWSPSQPGGSACLRPDARLIGCSPCPGDGIPSYDRPDGSAIRVPEKCRLRTSAHGLSRSRFRHIALEALLQSVLECISVRAVAVHLPNARMKCTRHTSIPLRVCLRSHDRVQY